MKRRAFLTASTAAALSLVHRLGETLVRGRLTMADSGRITTAVGPLLTVATAYPDRLRGNADKLHLRPRPAHDRSSRHAPPAMLLRPPAPIFGTAFGTVF
ncbi:hypothetical protein QC334_06390 [Streptomyces sp. DH18]|uniref:hypothetical protein n=1 Tax=Streptomyces sp. DH18 TaxID=3040126 RepID=UPI0024429196|nr:hypothetical protein [Streptomyces sp. DH18]MDG9682370.1 hypothetical protein [Streptomyces sp. DH18]